MSEQRPTPALAGALTRFDGYSVRRGAAALALWPRNADRHVALSALVTAVAVDPRPDASRRPPIEAKDWRRWLASAASANVRAAQPAGMHDTPAVLLAVIAGEPCILLAGALEYPNVHYRLWTDSIEAALREKHDAKLAQALALIYAGAWLSTRAATLGGLPLYPWPDHALPLKLAAPPEDEYARLLEAVTIPAGELTSAGIRQETIAPLLRTSGSPTFCRPLSLEQNDETILIADPWQLTRSVLVHASTHLPRAQHLEAVIKHARTAASRVALHAARDMDWPVERVDQDTLMVQPDVDCRILITTLVLPPEASDEPNEEMHQPELLEQSARRAHARADELNANYSLLALLGDGRAVTIDPGHPAFKDDHPPRQWTIGIGDLQLLGDSLRRDPLAVPSALERVPPQPWPENTDLLDVIGAVRQDESLPAERKSIPRDGTEHLRLRGMIMSSRQPAPHRDGTRWGEVTRWGGSQDAHVFHGPEDDVFSLLVGAPGVSIWFTPRDPSAGRFDLPGVLSVTLTHWFARLCDHGWPSRPGQLVTAVSVQVTDEHGPALAVSRSDREIRLVAGPTLIHELCRGDNTADRTLVHALLSTLAPDTAYLLEQVIPEGHGTFTIWPAPDVRSNPPAFEPPPIVHPRDGLRVERELAACVLPPEHAAIFRDEQVLPYLRDLRQRLDAMIDACGSTLDPACLIELVRLHQRAAVQTITEEIATPARAAIVGGDSLLGERESLGPRDMALRGLIERFSASPPSGTKPLSALLTGWLRAATELLIRMGATHDALVVSKSRATLAVSTEDGIAMLFDGPVNTAGTRRIDQVEREAPDLMVREHADWWSNEPAPKDSLALNRPIELGHGAWARVNRAMTESWGISLEQLLRVNRTLSEIAGESEDRIAACALAELAKTLHDRTMIDLDVIERGMSQLTLRPISEFNATVGPFMAWRPNRERSYLRRPLVALPDGRLCFSEQHPLVCARYLIDLIDHGRLRGPRELSVAVTQLSQEVDRAFEDAVLQRVTDGGMSARGRLVSVGGAPLCRPNDESIGDIDVLAWSETDASVWLLEAKRLAPGTEARAARREHKKLVRAAARHNERLEWARANPDRLSAELGLDQPWDIHGAIVIDRPLAGAYYGQLGLPVFMFAELPECL
jgi:hypothetical protein